MDPHENPELDQAFGEEPPVDDDPLGPARDLLESADGPLVPDHAGPPGRVDGLTGDIADLAPIVDDLAPAEPAPEVVEPDRTDPLVEAEPDSVEPSDAPAAEPINLDLGTPADLEASGQHEPHASQVPERSIDLSLDHDLTPSGAPEAGDATADAPDDAPDAAGEEILLPLTDLSPPEYPVGEGNAEISAGLIAAAAAVIGASVQGLRRLRRTAPPEVAAHLDALGIDARVEHLDLTGLEELLGRGDTVLLSTDGSAGVDASTVLQLLGIDRGASELRVLDHRGGHRSVGLAAFEEAWADSAHQVVQARGAGGEVALVPVVIRSEDLLAAP